MDQDRAGSIQEREKDQRKGLDEEQEWSGPGDHFPDQRREKIKGEQRRPGARLFPGDLFFPAEAFGANGVGVHPTILIRFG